MSLNLNQEDLNQAVLEGILSETQALQLRVKFSQKEQKRSGFNAANVAYYFGALIVISAMTWFMTSAWESFGGWGIFLRLGICTGRSLPLV